MQPANWDGVTNGEHGRRFYTYGVQRLAGFLGQFIKGAIVCFGDEREFSIGDVVHYEQQIDGRELVTLQMRSQFSFLPSITLDRIEDSKTDVKRLDIALEKVKQGYRKSPPESVIDRCREAFTVIFQILVDHDPKEDLGSLIKKFERSNSRSGISSGAFIVSRMHGRAKEAEYMANHPMLHHRDADAAVLLLGTAIVSLGWGNW